MRGVTCNTWYRAWSNDAARCVSALMVGCTGRKGVGRKAGTQGLKCAHLLLVSKGRTAAGSACIARMCWFSEQVGSSCASRNGSRCPYWLLGALCGSPSAGRCSGTPTADASSAPRPPSSRCITCAACLEWGGGGVGQRLHLRHYTLPQDMSGPGASQSALRAACGAGQPSRAPRV